MADIAQLIHGLDAEAIRKRIDELDSERAALRVLLRAARRARPTEARPPRSTTPRREPKGVRA